MKRLLILISVFFIFAGILYAQDSPVMRFDEAVSSLAAEIHAKLTEKGAENAVIGQFTFNNDSPAFNTYWINQLIDELVNMRARNYLILSGNTVDTAWTITGEIVQVADIFRVYSRLTRLSDRAIEGSFTSSFVRDEHINNMFSLDSRSGSSEGRDSMEPDSWESPVFYPVDINPDVAVMNRALSEDDEDFFLIIPDTDGRLTAETTGNVDTYMILYEYDTEEELADNDDGGQGANSRISYNVRAGTQYLIIVSGYSSSITGPYGFRAYLTVREGASGFNNPIPYEIGASEEDAVTVNRTLQQGSEDYFLLAPAINGRLTMETTGRTDTYIEFFDAGRELLERNDDGGQNNNARIRYNVLSGNKYFLMVRGYNQNTTGSYGFRAFFPGTSMMQPDEYEPNNEPSLATFYEAGITQQHNFHNADDVDWIRFHLVQAGRYTINVRGVNNNRLDTYIELFDGNMNRIAEDDDGGDSLSSRLSLNLNSGIYYLKIWCLDEEPDQGYTLNIIQ
ncbi:MAG: DVUA0089 family protein [Treponema sp.]|jgi:hypothetical protein|nr:DVUA0089 family protein [Treponema sp.]